MPLLTLVARENAYGGGRAANPNGARMTGADHGGSAAAPGSGLGFARGRKRSQRAKEVGGRAKSLSSVDASSLLALLNAGNCSGFRAARGRRAGGSCGPVGGGSAPRGRAGREGGAGLAVR
ncbi:ribosomal large subunit pseudouridine synthase B-like [Corvus kubaryi]|uniref:ribosomal large subunit pseudouridine synthase B-like n=1 Tax=Corvus kubaryi TaxID=68294 RepID=UPI001C04EC32|nr:ribosomal large subunit pseudouridine synthase B-like [Corvus kubaryi]